MAVPVQRDVKPPVITGRMTVSEVRKALRKFQARLNEDRAVPPLRRPRGAKLSSDEIILLMQRREHLPAQHVVVEGRRYARVCDWGNPSSEAIVRQNLRQFVAEVRAVVKEALKRNKQGLLLDMCRSYEDGMGLAGFFTKAGTPLGKNRALAEAIKQFFKDQPLVLKIVLVVLEEMKKELGAQRLSLVRVPIAGRINS